MNKDSTQDQPGSSSIPIRAPLTVDSDSEYYLSSCNSSTTSSVDISSFNDEHDDFGTYPHDEFVLQQSRVGKCELIRPFVKYPDGDNVKECVGFDKNEIFRPFVKCPDGKDCSGFDKNGIFRPFVKYPNGIDSKDCGGLDKNEIFRPFVKCPDGNDVKDCGDFGKKDIFRPFVKYPDGDKVKDCGGSDIGGVFRPIVKCADGNNSNNAKDCDGFNKVGVFRSVMKYPYGDNVKDYGGIDKGGVFRPIVKCSDGNESKNVNDCDGFDEVGVFRPIVKYPYGSDAKNYGEFDKGENVRTFVKDACEGSGSKLGAPVARLSGDSESESDVDSVDGVVDSVVMAPKVRIFSGDEGDDGVEDEGVFSGDDSSCISDLNRSMNDEGCRVECLNEVVKVSGSDEMSYELGRIDAEIASCSGNETISGSEQEVVFDGCGNQSEKTVNKKEEEMVATKIEMAPKFHILGYDEDDISDIDGSMSGCISDESIGDEGCKVECLKLVHELSELNEMSKTVDESEPEVRIFSGDEGDDGVEDEGVFSGDDSSCISDLNHSMKDEGCRVECLNEDVKVSESDEMSFDLVRSGAEIVPYSGNDIDIETSSGSEQEVMFDCCGNQSKKTLDQKEREMAAMEADMAPEVQIFGNGDMSHIDELDDSTRGCISDESIGDEGCKVECLNLVQELSELNKMSKTVNESEPEVVDVYRTVFKNRPSEVEGEMAVMKVVVATKAGAFSGDEGDDFNDIEELKGLNGSTSCYVPADTIEEEGYIVECLNEAVKLSEPDEPSLDLERIIARNVSDSGNEIESATTSGSEQEEPVVKMQPVKSKFLKLLRFLGLLKDLDSHLTILAIGKTGIGKSATINSIFSENKASTNAFDPGTTIIQEIVGTIEGIKLRVIDTPGLKCSPFEQSYNLKILKSIKKVAKKHTPDVVLYVDRLDTHTRADDDSHLLRLITSSLGSSVWCKCIIALTHATSIPTDESLRGFVFQRCRLIQENIHNNGGSNDEHMVNPVWLVQNHPSYKDDKSRMLEASDYLRHNIVLDDELDSLVHSDRANEYECDQVLPFEPLSYQKAVANCSVERRKAYFEEYSYRVKLLGTKHWSVACRLYL